MKKILVVLLILAVAGGLFAQGLTISGEIQTGVGILSAGEGGKVSGPADTSTDFVIGHHDPQGTRVRLNGLYEAENYGAKFGLQALVTNAGNQIIDPAETPNDASDDVDLGINLDKFVSIYNGYVWLDLFNDLANIKVGLIDDGAWGTPGQLDKGFATGLGIRLEITPIEGLNLGLMLKDGAKPGVPDNKPKDIANGNFDDTFAGMILGAKYESDLFDFAITADLDGDEGIGFAYFDDEFKTPNNFELAMGFMYKGVPGLLAGIDARLLFDNDVDGDPTGDINSGVVMLGEKFEYAIADNFRAGLKMEQTFANSDVEIPFAGKGGKSLENIGLLMFNLYGSYDLTDVWTVGAEVKLNAIMATNWDPKRDGYTSLVIKPNLTYTVADNASIEIFDEITIPMDGSDIKKADMERGVDNRLQINFVYSF